MTSPPEKNVTESTYISTYISLFMSLFTCCNMLINKSTLLIHLPQGLSRTEVFLFKPFNTWLANLSHSLQLQHSNSSHPFYKEPYRLDSITIQSVDRFGPDRIGFLKLSADIKNSSGGSLPGIVFLRGGSVAILLILEPEDNVEDPWVVLTVQPRIPAASLEMVELPAGMLDDGTFSGAAAREIDEECGITIEVGKLLDLTDRALGPFVGASPETLESAVYPSPGGSDEFIKIFAYRHSVKPGTLDEWRGKLTGLRDHGEKITLKVVRLRDLWKETADGKALAAVALYEGLRRESRI